MKRHSLILTLLIVSTLFSSGSEIHRYCFGEWGKKIGYSNAVAVDNTLYLSGIIGEGETMKEAVTLAIESIDSMLQRFDLDRSNILKENIYTNDIESLRAATDIRKRYYAPHFPAAVWIEASKEGMKGKWLEIELTIHIPDQHPLPEETPDSGE